MVSVIGMYISVRIPVQVCTNYSAFHFFHYFFSKHLFPKGKLFGAVLDAVAFHDPDSRWIFGRAEEINHLKSETVGRYRISTAKVDI